LIISLALLTAGGGLSHTDTASAQTSWECSALPHESTATVSVSPTADSAQFDTIPFPAGTEEILIFAAASLTDAFLAIEGDVESANPGVDLVFNFAGSQTLVTQLIEGAPADVFASANNAQMDAAIDEGVISGEPVEFARNSLAIVVPADNPGGVQSIADLDNDGVRIVLASEDVPVGGYSRTSICAAEAAGVESEGFSARVARNVVSNETNVRSVLAKIALGEADAGIVYASDITSDVAGDVVAIEIPADLNVVASYPIATVDGGRAEAAAAFISYVLSPSGQARLAEFGFS
jgi:molybdate transport system substrate-binding protein